MKRGKDKKYAELLKTNEQLQLDLAASQTRVRSFQATADFNPPLPPRAASKRLASARAAQPKAPSKAPKTPNPTPPVQINSKAATPKKSRTHPAPKRTDTSKTTITLHLPKPTKE